MIGANGVLNRVAEDGVLLPGSASRKEIRDHLPHHQYDRDSADRHHLGSRGDMTILAEAYAFGVVWSFFMKALGVMVLRFQRHDQEYKIPLNFRIGGARFPSAWADRWYSVSWRSRICFPSRSRPSTASRSRWCSSSCSPFPNESTAPKDRTRQRSWSSSIWITRRRYRRLQAHARPGLRAGGGARLPSHGASEKRARKDQHAAARHRGDDRASDLDRRRRIRAVRRPDLQRLREENCSATWWRWRKKKASRWSCWWCRR